MHRIQSCQEPPPPTINFDVLFRILDFATRDVAASLMRTCRTLNLQGAKHLFKSPVVLETDDQAVSFVQFFVARNDRSTASHRYHLLRDLCIKLVSPSQDAAATLTCFFTHIAVPYMANFVRLELHHPEELLGANEELRPAISALPLLQSIKVTNAGPLCGAMLEDLRSPLVFAYVDIDWESDIESDPGMLLCNARHTLQELSLNYVPVPSPRVLRRACPNLRHLHINASSRQDWVEMQEIRDEHAAQHSWHSLHAYSGSVNVLYMLHLRCPISRLDIHDEDTPLPPLALQKILLDSRPTHLILETDRTGASYYFNSEFISLFSQPGFWHWPLKTLELVIKFRPFYDEGVSVEDLLGNILRILRGITIRAFRLELDVSRLELIESSISDEGSDTDDATTAVEDVIPDDEDDDAFESEGPDMVPVECELEGTDLEGLVELVMAHQPYLETAIVSISGHTTRGAVSHQKGPDIVYDADDSVTQ
ncbi:hypothetical protein K466DRAFT_651389 [Polyporus arcularius HHB13444]|uniref:F-box domain-containing protein n=1 Tax=Polyporus arcularius HHB13444 TaxID=1314778 RepID=A0A5C3PP78_9APHY|nr:hypothetical protein K466DRAFT_651389 [Polyporus arcularius HHB13444]